MICNHPVGTPSRDAFSRLFQMIKPTPLDSEWAKSLEAGIRQIAINSKVLRRTIVELHAMAQLEGLCGSALVHAPFTGRTGTDRTVRLFIDRLRIHVGQRRPFDHDRSAGMRVGDIFGNSQSEPIVGR